MMIKNTKKVIAGFIVMLAAVLVIPFATASAVEPDAGEQDAGGKCQKNLLFPQWYDDLCDPKTGNIKSPNDLSGGGAAKTADDTANNIGAWLLVIVMNIVKTLLTVVGYVSLAFVIWGGFKYMTQGDNSSGTAGARKTIQNAIIGLVLSIMSVAIINLVTSAIV